MTSSDKPDNAADSPETPAGHTGVAAMDWAAASADPQYRAAVVD
ncbi:tRNA 2-methylthio-N6-isopentenyl adenosine(37) hydroxylase MiaE-like protein, partial [Streptomyces sp. SID7804]|nr:tRNA 2-methylthio-N6-isopentenyl adenosine(37) hydroxylase MiaE-like protein [Streptomyces sp. SID7804]